jgi:NAD(P)H-dependent FMN reductase
MKILAIGGSNSKNSINRQLAYFTAGLFENAQITKVDISDLDIPLYSVDKENEIGIPAEVLTFSWLIDESDLIVISLAENNGSFNVGLKNLLDWTSRIKDRKTFNGKKMLLMGTSPGARGATSVLEHAKTIFPNAVADIVLTYSLHNFYQNFTFGEGITNSEELNKLKAIISGFII